MKVPTIKKDSYAYQKDDAATARGLVFDDIDPSSYQRYLTSEHWYATIPKTFGGAGVSLHDWGQLCEQVGSVHADILNFYNVQNMVAESIGRWGTEEQKQYWLCRMINESLISAFCLTEPDVGSDAKAITCTAATTDTGYVLNGSKKWVSYGQVADLLLVVAVLEGDITAFLVERGTQGIEFLQLESELGFKHSRLAEVRFNDCIINADHILGVRGFGLSAIASLALAHGRFTIACGGVGLAQACLNASTRYARTRRQYGAPIGEHQLVKHLLCDVSTDVVIGRTYCQRVAYLYNENDPKFILEAGRAKYFTSQAATRAAHAAVQIHGANACSNEFPVARYHRDAQILEIIEGSSQMQQIMLGEHALKTTLPIT